MIWEILGEIGSSSRDGIHERLDKNSYKEADVQVGYKNNPHYYWKKAQSDWLIEFQACLSAYVMDLDVVLEVSLVIESISQQGDESFEHEAAEDGRLLLPIYFQDIRCKLKPV